MEPEVRSTWGKICFVLVHYDHEIVLEGLKQSIVVCAIVLFILRGANSEVWNILRYGITMVHLLDAFRLLIKCAKRFVFL